jgi:hypothetical protein
MFSTELFALFLQIVLGSVLRAVLLRLGAARHLVVRHFAEQSSELCGFHYVSGLVYEFPLCFCLPDWEQQQIKDTCQRVSIGPTDDNYLQLARE